MSNPAVRSTDSPRIRARAGQLWPAVVAALQATDGSWLGPRPS